MTKKYIALACCSVAAIFLFLHGFDYGDTSQIVKIKHSSDTKARKKAKLAQLTKSDDMVAAILIMPKSYLPALKRFSQSKIAKNIKILRAQLEMLEGKMTAIHQYSFKKQRPSENPTEINTSEQLEEISQEKPAQNDKPILAAGFLYLLASAHKTRPLN